MTGNERMALIRERLTAALQPSVIEITDDSHQHVGHAGARGGGHFTVTLVASAFTQRPLLARHRLVYDALTDALKDEIHALSIRAYAPDEYPATS